MLLLLIILLLLLGMGGGYYGYGRWGYGGGAGVGLGAVLLIILLFLLFGGFHTGPVTPYGGTRGRLAAGRGRPGRHISVRRFACSARFRRCVPSLCSDSFAVETRLF